MLTINLNNFKILVNKINRKWYKLQRISKTQTITTHATQKELKTKIDFFSQPIKEIKKAYNF